LPLAFLRRRSKHFTSHTEILARCLSPFLEASRVASSSSSPLLIVLSRSFFRRISKLLTSSPEVLSCSLSSSVEALHVLEVLFRCIPLLLVFLRRFSKHFTPHTKILARCLSPFTKLLVSPLVALSRSFSSYLEAPFVVSRSYSCRLQKFFLTANRLRLTVLVVFLALPHSSN
jgi:hypothetical protein